MKKSGQILVMDDAVSAVATIIGYLHLDGYQVTYVATVADAKAALSRGNISIAILDVSLLTADQLNAKRELLGKGRKSVIIPEEEAGFEVAAWCRTHFPGVGIVMYSSQKTDARSQLKGLEWGADEYILKGDDHEKFKERIDSVIERRAHALGILAQFNDCELDLGRKELRANGRTSTLSDTEFRFLEALILRPYRVYSRDALYQISFRTTMPNEFDRSIDLLASKVRRKLKAIGAAPAIQTIAGVGYRLDADVFQRMN